MENTKVYGLYDGKNVIIQERTYDDFFKKRDEKKQVIVLIELTQEYKKVSSEYVFIFRAD